MVIQLRAMIDQFESIQSGDDVLHMLRELNTDPAPIYMATTEDSIDPSVVFDLSSVRCHICSNELSLDEMAMEHFGDSNRSMTVHEGCHSLRTGLSSEAIMLSVKIGFWLVSEVQDSKPRKKWKPGLLEAWVNECGEHIGSYVQGQGVRWWDRARGIRTVEELVRFARHLYIHEREPPKFKHLGGEVPEWDEQKLSWSDYKRKGSPAGPFYRERHRLKKRYEADGEHKKDKNNRKKRPEEHVILARTGGYCAICGGLPDQKGSEDSKDHLAVAGDHILPFSKGGACDLANFQPTHMFCNSGISSVSGGHVPLGLQMGRWFISQAREDQLKPWVLETCNQYATDRTKPPRTQSSSVPSIDS